MVLGWFRLVLDVCCDVWGCLGGLGGVWGVWGVFLERKIVGQLAAIYGRGCNSNRADRALLKVLGEGDETSKTLGFRQMFGPLGLALM